MGLEKTLDKLAKTNLLQRYGHVLKRNGVNAMRRALDFKVVRKESMADSK